MLAWISVGAKLKRQRSWSVCRRGYNISAPKTTRLPTPFPQRLLYWPLIEIDWNMHIPGAQFMHQLAGIHCSQLEIWFVYHIKVWMILWFFSSQTDSQVEEAKGERLQSDSAKLAYEGARKRELESHNLAQQQGDRALRAEKICDELRRNSDSQMYSLHFVSPLA